MASGGEGAPTRDSIATRASTGKGKSVDYRQLLRGKHDGMDGSGEEEATGAGSGSVFYEGPNSPTVASPSGHSSLRKHHCHRLPNE